MSGLLKFITCGSVDDGKSTLIGHILYDSKLLYADQEKALELDSKVGSRGGAIDYSLLLDGLMAEREQGITIDVAYRYFTTDKRSFIVADTPGHEEYTRNMAVGASFADLAVILVDAKQGVLVQTRRHARICALMGIKYFVFAVNKMDLVDYSEDRFKEITAQIEELSSELSLASVQIIPVSATEGDNVTKRSDKMNWYDGPVLLSYLEDIDVSEKKQEDGFYMPVQRVCRPDHTFRGFQGQIESGSIAVGDEVITLPSNEHAKVKSILVGDRNADSADAGRPVTIQLDKEVDVSRGCVLTTVGLPVSKKFTATILWMDDQELTVGKDYLVKIGTETIPGILKNIQYKIDVNTGEYIPVGRLRKNEIAVCDLVLQEEIVLDAFLSHKTLGELILIDRITNMTSACGVVENPKLDESKDVKCAFVSGNLKANGDIFEEFYYDLESMTVFKVQPSGKTYTIGDKIPVEGESYRYPDSFDVVVLRDQVAVQVRDRKITVIQPLADYTYNDVPVINGRGFAVHVSSQTDLDVFKAELALEGSSISETFFNKWVDFETYRKIVFKDQHWN
ncbi:MAG: GTP-binding protein [Lachnobacterium sp.]|nr:GTP-binding protein [Lachnobacterium sp.]MCI7532188.1 GTP-binding protein [Lachnobacterium sp.]